MDFQKNSFLSYFGSLALISLFCKKSRVNKSSGYPFASVPKKEKHKFFSHFIDLAKGI